MTEQEWFVVCPTCRHVERVEDEFVDNPPHEQPCEACGWALMLVGIEISDDDEREVSLAWNVGEGAQLYLDDAAKAIDRLDEFLAVEEAEDDRIESALDDMRRERQQQEEEN